MLKNVDRLAERSVYKKKQILTDNVHKILILPNEL